MKELAEYKKKRNFNSTLEPKGEPRNNKTKKNKTLKFVVQHHLSRKDHYDFRLEWKGVLLSWAVPKGPSYNPIDKRLAIQVEDHPIEYGDFEGTIPKGEYGGGTVMLWDTGTWEAVEDVDSGLSKGSLKFQLFGKRLKGKWALFRMKNNNEKDTNWILRKDKDECATDKNKIEKFSKSIKTDRTMIEIEKNKKKKFITNPFNKVDVQLVKMVDSLPEDEYWIYELKYDGYRMVAFIENGEVKLITRNHKNYTSSFTDIANSLIEWSNDTAMVLDGEIVITDDKGKINFQLLQNHIKSPNIYEPAYVIFDILAYNGKDLRNYPLIKRKQLLKSLMKNAPNNICYSEHVKGNSKEIFDAACKLESEGVVAKKENSFYTGTRNGDWVKLKCYKRQEFVIGGYTISHKKISGISSLLLGYYKDNNLMYAGRCGTGMTEKIREEIKNDLDKSKQSKCPFTKTPNINTEKIFYSKPKMICEVQFAEWTEDNILRQASFKGIRIDKEAKNIIKEMPKISNKATSKLDSNNIKNKTTKHKKSNTPLEKGKNKKNKDGSIVISDIKISSPEKIVFNNPKIKKIDIVEYYSKVAKRMMPYIENRIISIKRCPDGINDCFFERNFNITANGIVEAPVKNSEGKISHYFCIQTIAGLIYAVQLNTIEFHTWGCTIENIDKPDMMTFDLDPDEGMDLSKVRQGVKDLKSVLNKLSLKSFLKTSGGKGYHVVVPFKPTASWDKFSDFAKKVANLMEENWPDRYTSNIRKASRKNRIFIDWIRNTKSATSVAPYSVRAKKGASVSMPISWRELDSVTPNSISISDALLKIKKTNPWKNFFNTSQELN